MDANCRWFELAVAPGFGVPVIGGGSLTSELDAQRRSTDAFFASEHSPLTQEQRARFSGLAYYSEDPTLRWMLPVAPIDRTPSLEMQLSTGDVRHYRRVGFVRFDVGTQAGALTLYSAGDDRSLFVPFRDITSGSETYAAGRYLDVDVPIDGHVVIDFNLAYNPYCAYNQRWACPLPPAENTLTAPIRAGEKAFEDREQI